MSMARDCIKIDTTVTSPLKRWILFRGTILALLGVGIFFYAGIYLPKELLAAFGIPLWLLGISLIAFGLIPYKLICRLENNPYELIITDDNQLHYVRRGKKIFTVPLYEIEKIETIGGSTSYGVGFKLKKGFSGKFPKQEKNLIKYGVDIYLPHFTPRACKSLKAYIDPL